MSLKMESFVIITIVVFFSTICGSYLRAVASQKACMTHNMMADGKSNEKHTNINVEDVIRKHDYLMRKIKSTSFYLLKINHFAMVTDHLLLLMIPCATVIWISFVSTFQTIITSGQWLVPIISTRLFFCPAISNLI